MNKKNLTVVLVAGVSPESVVGFLSPGESSGKTPAGSQAFLAKGGGSLLNVWGERTHVDTVVNRLAGKFGRDRVVINPAEDKKLKQGLGKME